MSTPVPFLQIHERVLQLVSDDTSGDWLGWAVGREELAITLEDWKSASTCLPKGHLVQPSAFEATPLPITLGFHIVVLLLWSPSTGTVRPRFWFVALSKQTLCKCGCGWSAHARIALEPREAVLRPHAPSLHGNKEARRRTLACIRSVESDSWWLVVTTTSRDAAISWGLALVVGDPWISEPREWPVLLRSAVRERKTLGRIRALTLHGEGRWSTTMSS